jgi:hypothetical protein
MPGARGTKAAVVMAMLHKEPGQRPTMRQVATALQSDRSLAVAPEALSAPTLPPTASEAAFPSSPSSRSTLGQGAGESLRPPSAPAAAPEKNPTSLWLLGGLGLAVLLGLGLALKPSPSASPAMPAAPKPPRLAPLNQGASPPAATPSAPALPPPLPPAPSSAPSPGLPAGAGQRPPKPAEPPLAEPGQGGAGAATSPSSAASSSDPKSAKTARRAPAVRDEIPLPRGLPLKPASPARSDDPIPLPKRLSPRP